MVFKNYSKEEIQEIIKDSQLLKNEIINSKGFVLYVANKNSVEIPVKTLMETISEYSIRYIKEDMAERKYSKSQHEIIMSYLTVDKKDNGRIVNNYSFNDLISDIKNENEIPANIEKFYTLTISDFNKNSKEILSLIQETDFFSQFRIPKFIEKFFNNLSQEEFNQIDKKVFIENRGVLMLTTHLLTNEKQKQVFNEILKEHYKLDHVKKGGYKNNLENYIEYPFDEKEKDFFIELLHNGYEQSYFKIKKYPCFNTYFNKLDYILEHDIKSCFELTEKEFTENIETIRKKLKSQFFLPHYKRFEDFFYLRVSNSRAKELFSEEYVKELVLDFGGYDHPYMDRDNKEKGERFIVLAENLISLCAKDNEVLSKIGLGGIFKLINELKHLNISFNKDEVDDNFTKIVRKFPSLLDSDNLLVNFERESFSSRNGNFRLAQHHGQAMVESMKDKAEKNSVNYLIALLQISTSDMATVANIRNLLVTELKDVVSNIDKNSLKKIEDLLGIDILKYYKPSNDKKLSEINTDYKHNIFQYGKENILNMNEDMVDFLIKKSIDFRKDIIKFNLEKDIFFKNNRFPFLLNELTEDKNNKEKLKFMQDLIQKNIDSVKKDFLSSILSHPMSDKLIKINTVDVDNDNFNKAISKLQEYEKAIELQNLFAIKYLNSNENEKIKMKKQKQDFENFVSENKKEIHDYIKKCSFTFKKEKLSSMPFIQAYKIYKLSIYRDEELENLMQKRLSNLSFEETKELFNDKVFIKNKIESSYSYGSDKTLIINEKFNKEQNLELLKILIDNMKNPEFSSGTYKSYDKLDFSKLLNLFKNNKLIEFSNEAMIKYSPESVFFTYSFSPRTKSYNMKSEESVRIFTNDEIMQVINRLNEKGLKVISETKNNRSYASFISNNFNLDNPDTLSIENDMGFKRYKEILKNLENDPLNYIGFINSQVVSNFIEEGKHEYRDITISEFYNNHINHKVIIDAIKEIKEKAINQKQNNESESSLKECVSALTGVLAYTYYSNGDDVRSIFDDEKSKEIIKALLENTPYLLFELKQIGKVNVIDEITNNLNDENMEKIIKGFLLSENSKISGDNLRLNYENRTTDWQSVMANNLTNGIINYCINNKKYEYLNLMDFMIKEEDFNDEKPYEKHKRDFSTPYMGFLNNEEFKNKIEKASFYTKVASSIKNEEKKEVKFKI